MSYSLMQQGGSFSPSDIQILRVPYCNAGVTVYQNSTYVDGVLQPASTTYQNEDGDVLALTAAQIAALSPGECDREYNEEGDLICAAGVTLKRIEIYNNSSGATVPSAPAVIFVNPVTNLAVAAPASFTWGACSIQKVPQTSRVYVAAMGAIAVPVTARREVVAYNRSGRDILVTWTGTLGGGGTFTVPARGSHILSLTEIPTEGLFATITTALDTFGAGVYGANQLLLDFKN